MPMNHPAAVASVGTRAFLIGKITCFIDSPTIREFHFDMFHGLAEDISGRPRVIGSGELQSLRIMRNVYNAPDVFAPHTNLVVSARVRDALASLNNLRFLAVEFTKLVTYPYAVGDFSWYDDPEGARPADLFTRLDDLPEGREMLGQYFELVMPRLADVQRSFADLTSIRANVGRKGYEKQIDLRLSADVLREYPILFVPGAKIFNEVAFNAIKPFLDRDFFTVTTIQVP